MNKGFKMFLGFVALSLVVGMSANAHRIPIVNEGGDSTKVEEVVTILRKLPSFQKQVLSMKLSGWWVMSLS